MKNFISKLSVLVCFLLSIVCCSEAFAVVFDDSTYNTLDKINLDTISKKEMHIIFGLAKRESDNEKKQLLLKISAAGLLSIGEKRFTMKNYAHLWKKEMNLKMQ